MSPQTRPQRRIPRLVATGAGLALLGGAALSQLGAEADPVSSDVDTTCSIATSSFDLTVPVVVDDTIDPVAEGGQEIVVLETGLPELPVEVTINRLVVTLPTPTQIASVDDVAFTGGNMSGAWAVSGSDLVLTFTGPQSSSAMDLPTVTVDQTVADDIAPTTITWTTFSKIEADTNYGMATCVPKDPGQVVNTTEVEAAEPEPTPTTTVPDEPTEPTPTTTVPDEPTPDEPDEPAPTEPPAEDGSDVSVDVEIEADLPDLPHLPGLPSAPTVPGAPLPAPGGSAPGLPSAPALPPLPSDPPALPLPGEPEAPAPTPTPTLPALPGFPEVELDAEATLEVGIGL